MGDIIGTLSFMLKFKVRSDSHVIFHYPPDLGYDKLLPDIMNSFEDTPFKVTWEVVHDWYNIKEKAAVNKFGKQYQNSSSLVEGDPVWFFTGTFIAHAYWMYKTKWQGNTRGPIALVLNHEFFGPEHPLPDKFFTPEVNERLAALVDGKNFLSLGMHNTYQENLDIISRSRYILGNEGGWTHVSNSMRAPFMATINRRNPLHLQKIHGGHSSLQPVLPRDLNRFLDLSVDGASLFNFNKKLT